MDTPHPRDFLELITESEVLPKDSTNPSGVLLVQDEQNHPLTTAEVAAAAGFRRHRTPLYRPGGDKTAFASWSIPSCKHSSKCIVLESTLCNEEAPIKGRFYPGRQAKMDGNPSNHHRLRSHRSFSATMTREFPKIMQIQYLRSVASNRVGEFWSAGRGGGSEMGWNTAQHQHEPTGRSRSRCPTDSRVREQGCLIGRTTDFYSHIRDVGWIGGGGRPPNIAADKPTRPHSAITTDGGRKRTWAKLGIWWCCGYRREKNRFWRLGSSKRKPNHSRWLRRFHGGQSAGNRSQC